MKESFGIEMKINRDLSVAIVVEGDNLCPFSVVTSRRGTHVES